MNLSGRFRRSVLSAKRDRKRLIEEMKGIGLPKFISLEDFFDLQDIVKIHVE
jgi:hypothetical protein